jgi:uncharacterized membrane protein YjdF
MTVHPLNEVDHAELQRPPAAGHDVALITIASAASVLFLLISATAKIATYRINPIFLIPLMWAPYFFRRRMHLHAAHYLLFALAILFHDLGAYGLYRSSRLPFSYDILVHYYFAVPVTLMLYRAIRFNLPQLRPWVVGVTALLFMMGFGALHEIMEYGTYLVAGEEKGMLKPSTSHFFDSQRDLTNNLLGTLTALLLVGVHYLLTRKSGRP